VYTTMSEEHRRIVWEEVTHYDAWLETNPLLRRGRLAVVGHLTEIFLYFTAQAASFNTRLYALPPEVSAKFPA
ncbi:MAG: hypothetical protein M3362_20830, partial [Acidobacteriota bacterium]|nr:hypothetical protein [Acidobacteriota bacterium]